MKRIICLPLLVLAATAGTFIKTYGLSSYGVLFNHEYRTSGTPLDSCDICHLNGSRKTNSYGNDFRKSGHSLNLIEEQDSDGDGFTNITEIAAGTRPGDAHSRPTPTMDLPKVDKGS